MSGTAPNGAGGANTNAAAMKKKRMQERDRKAAASMLEAEFAFENAASTLQSLKTQFKGLEQDAKMLEEEINHKKERLLAILEEIKSRDMQIESLKKQIEDKSRHKQMTEIEEFIESAKVTEREEGSATSARADGMVKELRTLAQRIKRITDQVKNADQDELAEYARDSRPTFAMEEEGRTPVGFDGGGGPGGSKDVKVEFGREAFICSADMFSGVKAHTYTFDKLLTDCCRYWVLVPKNFALIDDKGAVWPGHVSVQKIRVQFTRRMKPLIIKLRHRNELNDEALASLEAKDEAELHTKKIQMEEENRRKEKREKDAKESERRKLEQQSASGQAAASASATADITAEMEKFMSEDQKRALALKRGAKVIDVNKERVSIIRELLLYMVFIIVYMIAIFSRRSISDSYSMREAILGELVYASFVVPNTFKNDYGTQTVYIRKNFTSIENQQDFFAWLSGPLYESIYTSTYYNDDALDTEQQFALRYYNHLIGAIRIQEQKITNTSCTVAQDYVTSLAVAKSCWDDFDPIYISSDPVVLTDADTGISSSIFVTSQFNSTITGELATYGKTGLFIDLPRDSTSALTSITSMTNSWYLDEFSRFIRVSMNLFNGNVDSMAVVNAIFEVTAGGKIVPRMTMNVFRLYTSWTTSDSVRSFLFILCLIYVIYTFIRTFFDVRRMGFKVYFRQFWNLLELIIFVLLIVSVAYNALYTYTSESATYNISLSDTGYTDLKPLSDISEMIFLIDALLALFVLFKVFKYFQFSNYMTLIWDSLFVAFWTLAAYFFIFTTIFVAYVMLGHYMFGDRISGLDTISKSFSTLFKMILGSFDYQALSDINPYMAPIFFYSFMMLVIFVLLNVFLAIVNDTYQVIKKRGRRGKDLTLGEMLKLIWQVFYDVLAEPYRFIKNRGRKPKAKQTVSAAQKGQVKAVELTSVVTTGK
eukprot:GILK01006121.1.p1 GENE.GILK01006121.1~~GILK01006121.1.p1  ORF type:complete len:936 (-),score=211.15 GILK01006121.1:87-2894(-)